MQSQLFKLLEKNWDAVEEKIFYDERYQKAFQIIEDTYKELKEEGLIEKRLVLGWLQEKPKHCLYYDGKKLDYTLEGRRKVGIVEQLRRLSDDRILQTIVYQCNSLYNYALDEYLNPIIVWKRPTDTPGEALLQAKRFRECVISPDQSLDVYRNILGYSLGTFHVDDSVNKFYLVFHKFGENRAGKFKKYYLDESKVKYNKYNDIMIELDLNKPLIIKSYMTQKLENDSPDDGTIKKDKTEDNCDEK